MRTTVLRQKQLWRHYERLRHSYSTEVRGVQCHRPPILVPLFLPLLTDSHESRWGTCLTSWLSPLSCYFEDHCRLSEALSVVKWGCLLLCFVVWESTSIVCCIFTLKSHLSGSTGTANHTDTQKIRIIGLFFGNRPHWQFEVRLLLFTAWTCF